MKISFPDHYRSKARSGVVQRKPDRKTPCLLQDHQTPRSQRRTCRNPASGSNREHYLDRILEGQIEGLRQRKNRMQFVKLTRQKAAPCSLLNARETIHDASVARHLSASDFRIGILCLNQTLDALNGRSERLRNGTSDSSEEEIGGPTFGGQLLLRHAFKTDTVHRTAFLILRIMTDPKRILTKKYLVHKPCLKGEHQMR